MPHPATVRAMESRGMTNRRSRRRSGAATPDAQLSRAPFGEGVFGDGEHIPYEFANAMSEVWGDTLLTFGEKRRSAREAKLRIEVARRLGTCKGSQLPPISSPRLGNSL